MFQLLMHFLLRLCCLGLLPTRAVRLRLGTLIAADTTTLAPAGAANVVALIAANFTPSENLVVADLTLASFDGSTPLAGSTGAQLVGIDPITGEQLVTIKEPLGGWRWITTGAANLPQTIYGYCLLVDGLGTMLGITKLPTPIQLTAVGQQIDLGRVALTFVLEPVS